MEFSQVLTQLMQGRGYSKYRLAKLLDTSQSTIAYWMSGAVKPHRATQKRLAELFGVSVEYLMTGKK